MQDNLDAPVFFLVTCGTSALKEPNRLAFSVRNSVSLDADQRAELDRLVELSGARNDAGEHGAERDTIAGYLEETTSDGRARPVDCVLLVTSGTEIGQVVADRLIEPELAALGFQHITRWTVDGFRTDDADACLDAMDTYLRELVEVRLPNYSTHKKVFACSGGFKALTNYTTVLGTLYADEIIYRFEDAKKTIAIPRLPLDIDMRAVYPYLDALRLIREGKAEEVPSDVKSTIPESLLDSSRERLSWLAIEILKRLDAEVRAADHVHWPRGSSDSGK